MGEPRPLADRAVEEILQRLGFTDTPAADLRGLSAVYAAWCRHVPFDNLRKLVALHYEMPELPGIDPADFFAAWQVTGAGGTCWPSNNGLHALLVALGFDARRHGASMVDGPEVNHGTTMVRLDGRSFLVDTAMLSGQPLLLEDGEEFRTEHVGYVVTATPEKEGWLVRFPTPDPAAPMVCRIRGEIGGAEIKERYERSRQFSVFNDVISCRSFDDGGVWLVRGEQLTRIDLRGTTVAQKTPAEIDEFLVDEVGHAPQLVAEVRSVLEDEAARS